MRNFNDISLDMKASLSPVNVTPAQPAGFTSPHSRGKDQLVIDLIFHALPFQRLNQFSHYLLIRDGTLFGNAFFLVGSPSWIVDNVSCLDSVR